MSNVKRMSRAQQSNMLKIFSKYKIDVYDTRPLKEIFKNANKELGDKKSEVVKSQ